MMLVPTSKTAEDVAGMEYDWLGCDSKGHVALFSTAGAGYPPAEFLRDTDAHELAIRSVLALAATTGAQFHPPVAPGLANPWRLVAERGLYAYDSDMNGRGYRLVAAPIVAVTVEALPAEIVRVARDVTCPCDFATQAAVTDETLLSLAGTRTCGRE